MPLLLFLSISTNALSAKHTAEIALKGKVSEENGSPLPGVSILIKGSNTGTTTDSDGSYTITVPDANAVLVFSYVGFVKQEVIVGSRNVIDVKLLTDAQALTEIVVVGYGEQKKETLTGSVTTVKGTDIVKSPAVNVSNSLAGRLPGVTLVSRSGEPGQDGSTIRIRGVNTLGNNDALVVVDGIPGRSLDRIDPNSIETISVLKDASAAIYGAQAANGVILITTKRGKTGKPTITFNANQGFSQPTILPEMTNAAEYAQALNEVDLYRNRSPRYTAEDIAKFADGSDLWKYPNTDWFESIYKKWSGQHFYNATVSGGSEAVRYFVSLGTKTQDGYYKNSATKYTQHDFRTNLDATITKNINLRFDVSGRMEDKNYPTRSAGDILWMVMRGKPNMPAYWPNGATGPDIEYGNNPVVVSTNQTGYDRDKWYVLNSTIQLNVKIPWIQGLSLTGNTGIDKGFNFRKRFQTPWYLNSWDGTSRDANGQPILVRGKKGVGDPNLNEYMEDKQDILLNGYLNYEKAFGTNHMVKFLVGTEKRSGNGDKFSAYRRYFVSNSLDQLNAGGDAEKDNTGTAYQSARMNYFGRVNYGFKEKYLVEFVWRVDGSYIFPEAKRFGFFPGVSAGWRVSEEEFWKNNLGFINQFKLRASWGQTGNDRIEEWQYLGTYGFQTQNMVYGVTTESKTLGETRIPNPNVTWEVANQADIGFDASLLNDRLNITFDVFDYRRSKLLWKRNASVPSSTGLTLPSENIGKTSNKGFDFNVSYRGQGGDLKYTFFVNGGYAINKVNFIDESPGRPDYQLITGHPLPTKPADQNQPFDPDRDLYYESIGIFKDQSAVDNYPHWGGARPGDVIFRDVNEDGKIDANDRVRNYKTDVPRFQGGLGTNLQFKGFDLSILFQAATGALRYLSLESGDFGNYWKEDFDGRWTPDNINASKPRASNRSDEYWRSQRNTYLLHNTNYVRLKNLEFGYTIPSGLATRLGLQNLRFYVNGNNLATYCPGLKGFDPEDNNTGGINYPLARVVNGGLSLTF
ncbi:TonB-dependent receptor [Dyadobacter psychrotolerans]|uniref:TonB-dependent receptor n=2 Tax=Dyadobacter psychrotolerans TaxID=2541721 RepID=A0A4R5DTH4_9BACT|nr:TonB-dependent receptor [Dyadobacter psychrotolerans]